MTSKENPVVKTVIVLSVIGGMIGWKILKAGSRQNNDKAHGLFSAQAKRSWRTSVDHNATLLYRIIPIANVHNCVLSMIQFSAVERGV